MFFSKHFNSTVVLILLVSSSLGGSLLYGQSPLSLSSEVTYAAHAREAFLIAHIPGELLNVIAINAAYRDSLRTKKVLTADQVVALLNNGQKHIRILNAVAVAKPSELSSLQPLAMQLMPGSPYHAGAIAVVARAIVYSSLGRPISSTRNSLYPSTPPVGPTESTFDALAPSALVEAIGHADQNAAFHDGLDRYYKPLIKVGLSDSAGSIIEADKVDFPDSLLADKFSCVSRLVALLQSQAEDATISEQSTKVGAFLSDTTSETVRQVADRLAPSAPNPAPISDDQVKELTRKYDDASATVEIASDVLKLAGSPIPAGDVSNLKATISIGKDIESLLVDPKADAFILGGNIADSVLLLIDPSAGNDAATLKQIGALQKQISNLDTSIKNQFIQVNNTLAVITAKLNLEFAKIEESQMIVIDDLNAIHDLLVQEADVNVELSLNLSDKVDALSRQVSDQVKRPCLTFAVVQPFSVMDSKDFNTCASVIEQSADFDSRNHVGSLSPLNYSSERDLLDSTKGLAFQHDLSNPLDSFDEISRLNSLFVRAGRPAGSQSLPNISDWITGALSLDLLLADMQSLRGTSYPEIFIGNLVTVGREIQESAKSLVTRKDQAGMPGVVNALTLYKDASHSLFKTLSNIESDYMKNAGIDPRIDLWDSPQQDNDIVVPFDYISSRTSGSPIREVAKLPTSNPFLKNVEPQVIRTAYGLGIVKPTPLPVDPPHTARIHGIGAMNVQPCIQIDLDYTVQHPLPDKSDALRWGSSEPSQDMPPNHYPQSLISFANLCRSLPPQAAALDAEFTGQFSTWLSANWLASENVRSQFENSDVGASFGIQSALLSFSDASRAQRAAQPFADSVLSKWSKILGINPILDIEEQTMDYHREQVEALVLGEVKDSSSKLSHAMLAVDNTRQVISDQIALGLSRSLAGSVPLQNFVARRDGTLDLPSAGTMIVDWFGMIAPKRSGELDIWMADQYAKEEAFRVGSLDGWPITHTGPITPDRYFENRLGAGHLTQLDLNAIDAYVKEVTAPLPKDSDLHTLATQASAQNDLRVASLTSAIDKAVLGSSNGETLLVVEQLLNLLQIDIVTWQAPSVSATQ